MERKTGNKAAVESEDMTPSLRDFRPGKRHARDAAAEAVSDAERERMENYLNGYRFCQRLLRVKKYTDKYFETYEWEKETPVELTLARAKMFEIRHFILALKNSNEKIMLYIHYINGRTVEECAELLGISRSSAFRLKKRALTLAFLRAMDDDINISMDRF